MSRTVRLEAAKAKLRQGEQAKTVAETQLKTAEENLKVKEAELAAEGVTPDTAQAELQKLDQEAEAALQEAERILAEAGL